MPDQNETTDLAGRLRAVALGISEGNLSDPHGNRVGLLRRVAEEIERLGAENAVLKNDVGWWRDGVRSRVERILDQNQTSGWSDWDAERAGFKCESGVGTEVIIANGYGRRAWLSWNETIALHQWIGQKIAEVS